MKQLRPSEIRFIQAGISANFKDGRSVNEAARSLCDGLLSPHDFPWIRVIELDSKYYSFDNRRLYAFRVAEYRGAIDSIVVSLDSVDNLILGRFDTPNDGREVRVRGGITLPHCRPDWLLERPRTQPTPLQNAEAGIQPQINGVYGLPLRNLAIEDDSSEESDSEPEGSSSDENSHIPKDPVDTRPNILFPTGYGLAVRETKESDATESQEVGRHTEEIGVNAVQCNDPGQFEKLDETRRNTANQQENAIPTRPHQKEPDRDQSESFETTHTDYRDDVVVNIDILTEFDRSQQEHIHRSPDHEVIQDPVQNLEIPGIHHSNEPGGHIAAEHVRQGHEELSASSMDHVNIRMPDDEDFFGDGGSCCPCTIL